MSVPNRTGIEATSRGAATSSRWVVTGPYVVVTLLLLSWGVGSFLFVRRGDLTIHGDDDAAHAQFVAAQLRFAIDSLLCLVVQGIFLFPGLRRRLHPDKVTETVVLSLFVSGLATFFGGYLALIGGIRLGADEPFPLLRAAAIVAASCAVILTTAAAALAVRFALASPPRWATTLTILVAIPAGIGLTVFTMSRQ